jgi:hypothetical protein
MLLGDLKHQFVSTVRKLADQANKDRIERLKDAIKAFNTDTESDLRTEILIDLESLQVSVRTLAFQTIQKSLRTQRERYVRLMVLLPLLMSSLACMARYTLGEIYKVFEDAVAKPILSLQDDSDSFTPEVTVKDLGPLIRIPVAMVVTLPFVLSAAVWLFMTKVFWPTILCLECSH